MGPNEDTSPRVLKIVFLDPPDLPQGVPPGPWTPLLSPLEVSMFPIPALYVYKLTEGYCSVHRSLSYLYKRVNYIRTLLYLV